MMRACIAFANLLASSGKTTAAATIGTELARRGYRVLLIYADPHARLTHHLYFASSASIHAPPTPVGCIFDSRAFDDMPTLADFLLDARSSGGSQAHAERRSLASVISQTLIPRLSLVASSLYLAHFVHAPPLALHRLAADIASLASRFDFVLIDTPSEATPLLDAAFHAATHVLIPVAPHPRAAQGR